jgi:hypothetical protein
MEKMNEKQGTKERDGHQQYVENAQPWNGFGIEI